MKEFVVISGKGGTGKTSIVASFAALFEKKVLVDCDVDAANLHLVVNTVTRHREQFGGGKKARILPDRCTQCGECQRFCRFEAITANGESADTEGAFQVDRISCEGCGVCVAVCPADAVLFEEAINGEWFISDTRVGPMVHARLGIAEGNSGKLVSLVRSQARGLAVKRGLELVLIDGPPGIGCPVIASITGTNLVLVVTEPTLSGLHDLERVRELTRHFKIKTVACVNKYDLNPEMSSEIERRCSECGVEVVGRIPYDNEVTRAQIRQQSIVEFSDGPVSVEIRRMWARVSEILGLDAEEEKSASKAEARSLEKDR